MILAKASTKSRLIIVLALAASSIVLWFVPAGAFGDGGDFFEGLRAGFSAVIGGFALTVFGFRFIRGKFPRIKGDERDRLIASRSGSAAFAVCAVVAAVAAVVLSLAYRGVAVPVDAVAVAIFAGMGLIYAVCRIVAEIRN
jgi:peptidoglycan/LPS O-acetylase OafA/YrhL